MNIAPNHPIISDSFMLNEQFGNSLETQDWGNFSVSLQGFYDNYLRKIEKVTEDELRLLSQTATSLRIKSEGAPTAPQTVKDLTSALEIVINYEKRVRSIDSHESLDTIVSLASRGEFLDAAELAQFFQRSGKYTREQIAPFVAIASRYCIPSYSHVFVGDCLGR